MADLDMNFAAGIMTAHKLPVGLELFQCAPFLTTLRMKST